MSPLVTMVFLGYVKCAHIAVLTPASKVMLLALI